MGNRLSGGKDSDKREYNVPAKQDGGTNDVGIGATVQEKPVAPRPQNAPKVSDSKVPLPSLPTTPSFADSSANIVIALHGYEARIDSDLTFQKDIATCNINKDDILSEPRIFDAICHKVRNWRRFGRLIGVEEHMLDNIEQDNSKKYDRLYECLQNIKEAAENPVRWGFLKERLLKFKEGGDIVDALEKQFPPLLNSIKEQNTDQEADKYMFLDMFDIISMKLRDWRRFATILHIKEDVLIELEGNEKYKDHLQEKVYRCIVEKNSTPDWFYWRKILLKMDYKDLVDDIEEKYPDLLKDERIDISDVVHKGLNEEFGILAHNASRTEHFEKLPIKLKDKIKVCVGGGREKMFQIKNMHTIQDKYFEKYKLVDNIKVYNFTNIGNRKECKILKTLYEWLHKNEDDGFCIKGYDAKRHLEFITDDYENKNPKESYILAYSTKHCCIFFIDTEPIDIKASLRENRSNIRPIRSSNQCLDDALFVFIPLTLYDPNKHKIDDSICKECIDLQLVVSAETFKDLDLFEQWWEKVEVEVEGIKSELEEKADDSNNFFRNIMTYMAFDSFLLPSFTINKENEIKEVQKLIMLTPEQQDIVYSINRHKVIKGPFGTGKTVVAQKILKLFANSPQDKEKTYYIMHDTESSFVKEMKKLAIKLNNKESIIACKRSDLVNDTNSLSSILEYLLATNKGKSVHVFIEEFNGDMLNKSEVEKIKILLENEEFKSSHIVIVAQSMESERSDTDDTFETKSLETYQYEKLEEETDFKIFHLSYMLRSSTYINEIVSIAIPILKAAKIKYILPKYDSVLNVNLTSSLNNDLQLLQTPGVNKHFLQTPNGNTFQKEKNGDKQESKIKDIDTFTSYEDTFKFLKRCTLSADNYSSKREIENIFKYDGERKTAHNVKGEQPVIYFPFKKETNKFVDQVFCLAEVLKVIINDKKEQVIICMNTNSMNMVKNALDVYNIKWTNDSDLLSASVCLLTEYTAVRGCEFLHVVLILPLNEHYLKQNLIACINRCIFDLKLMILNLGIPDDDLVKIVLEWINAGLVKVSDEDYLKNAEKLKRFIEINGDTLNRGYQNANIDINDPKVIQKLKSFDRSSPDNQQVTSSTDQVSSVNPTDSKAVASTSQASNNNVVGTVEAPASLAVFRDIWETCKEASRNNNRSLLMEALHRNNLDVNALYDITRVDYPYNKRSLLLHAAIENDVDVVKLLCSIDNIDVNTTNIGGDTPLMHAAFNNNIDVVRVLMNMNNIDVNTTNRYGNTALWYATDMGHNEIVDLLNNSS